MKRFLLGTLLLLMLGVSAQAAPGDTTWVQAQNDIWLDHFGNFDTTVEFPNGSKTYRKILMVWTLGKYMCPGSPQYCGDWDYTVQNFIMTKSGDTLELGRFITPYANASYARTGWSWKQRYMYDVTDLYNQLKDSAGVRIHYSGYSWGFTANVKFAFIEGTPPRDVQGIDRMWKGSYAYTAANPIDGSVTTMSNTTPANTQSAEFKFTISGHGSNNEGCSEFCKKYYQVKLNNSQIAQKDIWRDDCGYNHIYPQSGTWLYDRGNWCPGDIVFPNSHTLTGVGANANYDLDVDFQSTNGNNGASYSIQSMVVYYGGFNKSVDASLDDIIAPSDYEVHFRENPMTGKPKVKVQNTGSTTITSIKFEYGIAGVGSTETYTWSGSIAALETAEIEFPVFDELQSIANPGTFNVTIKEVNGQVDEDQTNDKLSSTFEPAMRVSPKIIIELRTNSPLVNGVAETEWKLYDIRTGTVVAQRTQNAGNTTYNDTITLNDGVYKFVVEDANCDGVSWWVYPNYPVNPGTGTIRVKPYGSFIGYNLKGYFSGDFGCGFTEYFNVGFPVGVQDLSAHKNEMTVFPNPAQNSVQVSLDLAAGGNGTLQIIDMLGRVVAQAVADKPLMELNTSALSNGMYHVVYKDQSNNIQLQQKIMIAK